MKRRFLAALIIVAGVALTTVESYAQSYGGAVLDHDIMMPADFASLSQTQVFGSSRSMAMGGAFTSLGADISSVGINPAGLGMYSHDLISFTPMVSVANSETTGTPSWVGNSKTMFSFANMGAVCNILESSSGSLISLNVAFTYNRLADYNTKMSFSSQSEYNSTTNDLIPTIVDVFGMQLGGAGIYPTSTGSMEYENDPYFWPAQSAYKTYLLDPTSGNSSWTTNTIGHNASVISSYSVEQSGRTDEYSFAFGGNIANVIYFGATIGLQEINQTTQYVYQEEYRYYTDEGYAFGSSEDIYPLDYQADYSNLWQETKLSGTGVNLKLGLTARPTRALRIGVAYHSPTYYSVARTYQTSTETLILGNYSDLVASERFTATSPLFIDNYEYCWRFRTPSKLLAGASLQVGSFGLLAVDYERQWYNWTRVTNSPGGLSTYDYKLSFENSYKPTNTLRVGLEVKPIPTVALRVGGGASSSMIKDESQFYSSPVATDSHYITCGVGLFLTPTTTLDIAYQYNHQNYTPYRLFYAEDSEGFIVSSNLFESSLNRSFISATLTFRI
ncbi:MAG: transporter [Rikenellaceae bacterium]